MVLTEIAEFIVKFFVGIFAANTSSQDYPKTLEFVKGIVIGLAGAILATIKFMFSDGIITPDMYFRVFLAYLAYLAYLACLGIGVLTGLFFIVVNYPYNKKSEE